MPLVCLSLTAKTIAENLAVLERYRGKIDIAELRADLLDPSEAFAVRDFPVLAGLPCILAVRRKCDGGGFVDGEGQRLVMLAKAIAYARPDQSANYAYVDLESDFRVPSVEEACHTFGTRIIRSRHDISWYARRPEPSMGRARRRSRRDPQARGNAARSRRFRELFTWASVAARGRADHSRHGRVSACPAASSPSASAASIAYTSALRAGLPVAAPGHLDPIALEETYRFRELDRDTTVYALGGGVNVLSSKTPQLHNAAFKAAGHQLRLRPDSRRRRGSFPRRRSRPRALKAPRSPCPSRNPCFPSSLDARPKWTTSAPAILSSARQAAGRATTPTPRASSAPSWNSWAGSDLRGLRATLVGAGGVAKAIAHVLSRLGVRTVILNRTVSKARVLSQRYGFAYGPCTEHSTELVTGHSDIIIQATSVGMDGERQGDPLDWYDFSGRESVFDLIYRPERSLLLERAAAAGCRITNGWKMLRYQSAAQFALWTGLRTAVHLFFLR